MQCLIIIILGLENPCGFLIQLLEKCIMIRVSGSINRCETFVVCNVILWCDMGSDWIINKWNIASMEVGGANIHS